MNDYWDVEAIFAEAQMVPGKFPTGAVGLGKALDPNSEEENVRAPQKRRTGHNSTLCSRKCKLSIIIYPENPALPLTTGFNAADFDFDSSRAHVPCPPALLTC